MESQPSFDAANIAYTNRDQQQEPCGADVIARELDEFNAKYQYLIDELYRRLQEIASRNPNDIVTLVSAFQFLIAFIMLNYAGSYSIN